MVWAYRDQTGERVALAMINSGGIKGFIDKGNITMENLLRSFPFRNTFDVVLIKGVFLRQAFEHSVASMESDGRNEAGRQAQCAHALEREASLPEMGAHSVQRQLQQRPGLPCP